MNKREDKHRAAYHIEVLNCDSKSVVNLVEQALELVVDQSSTRVYADSTPSVDQYSGNFYPLRCSPGIRSTTLILGDSKRGCWRHFLMSRVIENFKWEVAA